MDEALEVNNQVLNAGLAEHVLEALGYKGFERVAKDEDAV